MSAPGLTYQWLPMPSSLEVRCGVCGTHSTFEFAVTCRIKRRSDVEFFKSNAFFDVVVQQTTDGQNERLAVFYPGLTVKEIPGNVPLPEGYSANDWKQHKGFRNHSFPSGDVSNSGTLTCSLCNVRARHRLNWPEDSWYQFTYKSKTLWAFDRQHLKEIRDFVATSDRRPSDFVYAQVLGEMPAHFLSRGARPAIIHKIDQLLGIP